MPMLRCAMHLVLQDGDKAQELELNGDIEIGDGTWADQAQRQVLVAAALQLMLNDTAADAELNAKRLLEARASEVFV